MDGASALDTGDPVRHPADRPGLLVGQITEGRRVPLRLDHEVSPVRDGAVERMDVPDVDEIVLEQHPTLGLVSLPVLLADEAVHVQSVALMLASCRRELAGRFARMVP